MPYALVAVNVPAKNLIRKFLYTVPPELPQLAPGWRVVVPFGHQEVEGFVIATDQSSPKMAAYIKAKIEPQVAAGKLQLKPVHVTIGTEPWFDSEMLATAQWLAQYYMCTLAEAMRLFIPGKGSMRRVPVKKDGKVVAFELEARLKEKFLTGYRVTAEGKEAVTLPENLAKVPAQLAALKFLAGCSEPLTYQQAKEAHISADSLQNLAQKGWAQVVQVRVLRNSYDAAAERKETLRLTEEQELAVAAVTKAIKAGTAPESFRLGELEQAKSAAAAPWGEFLLQGITGSGKTEVYLRATEFALKMGKQVLLLVPEIALTAQIVRRFQAWFKDEVAVVHSKLSQNERADVWFKMRTGQAHVLIGVRSAVFAPFQDLGLVIIDEEHESSYKQEERPNYHARDVARERCKLSYAPLLLGSATPSLETYYRAKQGLIKHLRLTERPGGSILPEVAIVDMRAELAQKNFHVLSGKLRRELIATVQAGRQAIVLLNRRGYSTFVMCRDCGETLMCPHCAVSLVYHAAGQVMRCHYCGNEFPVPTECPQCHSKRIKFFGTGTQKAEQEIGELPGVRIIRMDQDSTTRKLGHEQILKQFATGKENVLLGTQMVAKGHDIPNVTLVGILAADSILNLPDFRAGERAFSLITQAAGRAGRGQLKGRVVLQTYDPENEIIQLAAKQDYDGFAKQELETREELAYPPFTQVLKLVLWHKEEAESSRQAQAVADFLKQVAAAKQLPGTQIAGPFPALVPKVRDLYKTNVLVKSVQLDVLKAALLDSPFRAQPNLYFDVDPLSML
jgi:primosomal protein N' (replication factor Y)